MASPESCFLAGMRFQIELDSIRTILDLIEQGRMDLKAFSEVASYPAERLEEAAIQGESCGVDSKMVSMSKALVEKVKTNDMDASAKVMKDIIIHLWAIKWERAMK